MCFTVCMNEYISMYRTELCPLFNIAFGGHRKALFSPDFYFFIFYFSKRYFFHL